MTQHGRTVLVVEDDNDVREITSTVLQEAGYDVVGVENGVAALQRLREGGRPAMVLLDLRMPKLDGAEFLRRSRAEGLLGDTPVVVFSGEARARQECASLDLAAFLAKPMELEDLLATVNRFAPMQEAG